MPGRHGAQRKALEDIQGQHLREAAIESVAALRRLAAVVASSADAIFTKDRRAVITSWNASAERMYGWTAEEAIGQGVALIVPKRRAGEEFEILDRILAGERVEHYETERVRKDGTEVTVSLTVSPVRDSTGEIVEASSVARDITAVRQVERQRGRLQAVTAALSEALTVDEVVDVVLAEGFRALDAGATVVALPVEGQSRLRLLGVRGYSDEARATWDEVTRDERLPLTDVLRTGEPLWITDPAASAQQYPDARMHLALGHDQSVAALPLVARGRMLGAMGVRFDRPQAFGELDRSFMLTLAQQCAQALDRAQLYELERAARRRAEYLAQAGAALGASLSPEATLEQVARLAVPAMADWAVIELLAPDGSIQRPAIVHRDPAMERWARELADRYPVDLEAEYGSAKVLRTGEPELIPEIPDAVIEAAAVDEEHARLLRQLGLVSSMVVPLRARGRIMGDIALVSAESGRHFDEADLAVAQDLADRCALAIDNARLFAERSYVAKTLQEGLLPAGLPDIPAVDLAVRYQAARGIDDVGGDFYDVFAARGGWTVVAGDVVGKGAEAAAVTGLARHTIRTAARYEDRPSQVLRALHREMVEQLASAEQFATVVCTRLEGSTLWISSAGHPLPIVLRRDGRVETAGQPGTLIGVIDDPDLHDDSVTLGPGDSVVLYTDGVTDARGPAGRFGEEQLSALLAASVGLPPAQLADRIERAVTSYQVGPLRDDVAIVVLRVEDASGRD